MAATLGNIAVVAGIASHITYFNKGEHHLYGTTYLQAFFSAFTAAVAFLVFAQGEQPQYAAKKVAWVALHYLGGLYSSLITYRLFLHPLNRFPGPLGARLSGFWFTTKVGNGDAYLQIEQLHEKYGQFVRFGPDELSIANPKAVNALYGQGSKCIKSVFYDLTIPMVSLQTYRDNHLHSQRRRVWSAAFGDRAVRGYEKRVKIYLDKLVEKIKAFDSQPVNVTKWFNLFSFDVMGDLSFGESFDMLENSKEHWAIQLLNNGIDPLAFCIPVWFFRIVAAIPGAAKDWWGFMDYCRGRMFQRMNVNLFLPVFRNI
jgi:tryprostatin B 6-hydroxylase